jgi:UDP-N-acetylmuramoyl-L-alanyl-D-glutamate--2,6-diaminopimelate ligase
LAVLNADDTEAAEWLRGKLKGGKFKQIDIKWYSKAEVKDYKYDLSGIKFTYKGQFFHIPLLGDYNLENSLAAINITNRYLRLPQISKALQSFQTPEGRMELIQKEPFAAIIDFAHTPHSLELALKALQPLKNKNNRVISVFGCAGKRDKKRREMGKFSAQLADITIVTSEDPRNEDLKDVNNDIINHALQFKGVVIKRFADTKEYKKMDLVDLKGKIDKALAARQKPIIAFDENAVASRVDAIDLAVRLAAKDDIVFCTGKAHEKSLCFGTKEYPWSEHRYLKKALEKIKPSSKKP